MFLFGGGFQGSRGFVPNRFQNLLMGTINAVSGKDQTNNDPCAFRDLTLGDFLMPLTYIIDMVGLSTIGPSILRPFLSLLTGLERGRETSSTLYFHEKY